MGTGTATWRRVSRAAGTQPEHRRIRRSVIAGVAFVIAVLTSAASGRAADKVKATLDPAVLEAVGQCAQHSAVTFFYAPHSPCPLRHTQTQRLYSDRRVLLLGVEEPCCHTRSHEEQSRLAGRHLRPRR